MEKMKTYRFLRLIWKAVCIFSMAMLALILLCVVPDIPGCYRFKRYVAYETLDDMVANERDAVRNVFTFQKDGRKYRGVVTVYCRAFASGPAVLIYDDSGRLVDKTRDIGDWHIEQRWGFEWADMFKESTLDKGKR